MTTKKATFAAGCFWGVEEAFRRVKGVADVAVGYIGGSTERPSYREVCSKTTGHAEAVEVDFDPAEVSFEALVETFWNIHDPTTKDRQGPDVGSQYRSAIFVHDEEQRLVAVASKERADSSGRFRRPIVTEITPASTFWRAEEYHQRYLQKHGGAGCAI